MSLFDKLIIWTIPLIPRMIVRRFADRYIAGSTLDDAMQTVRNLNDEGCMATLDVLGEFITKQEEAESAVQEYLRALDRITREKLDSNISVKLTMLGLKLDLELCYENVRRLVEHAGSLDNFVRIDMEDSSCTTETLNIYNRLRKKYDNVGFVIQAYMRRSLKDVREQIDSNKNINMRLCKGIYIEPRDIAYRDMAIINDNFRLLMEEMLSKGQYVGIATHDERLVWSAYRLIDRLGMKPNQFEFQMLLGVDEQLRRIILRDGYRLRVYVPYGVKWYEYSTRRLKENPRIATHILRNLFKPKT